MVACQAGNAILAGTAEKGNHTGPPPSVAGASKLKKLLFRTSQDYCFWFFLRSLGFLSTHNRLPMVAFEVDRGQFACQSPVCSPPFQLFVFDLAAIHVH